MKSIRVYVSWPMFVMLGSRVERLSLVCAKRFIRGGHPERYRLLLFHFGTLLTVLILILSLIPLLSCSPDIDSKIFNIGLIRLPEGLQYTLGQWLPHQQ